MAPRKRKVIATSPEKPKFSTVLLQTMLNGQHNITSHSKLIKELKLHYTKIPHESFMRSFIQNVKRAMEHDIMNPYAKHVLYLAAKFVADPEYSEGADTHPVVTSMFDWLLSTISDVQIIRIRICQLVNLILDLLGSEATLDDTICDKILQYMLDRMRDVSQLVRIQAVLALQRLQNPDDPEDCVFRAYIYHLDHDPSPKVRQTIITSLGKNYRSIPHILERLWDVNEGVRRHTYVQMSCFPVRYYKVVQRLKFLEQGLGDHSESVRKVVKNVLLPQWIESYQGNYVTFVEALKIDATWQEIERYQKTAKTALVVIFAKKGIKQMVELLGFDKGNKTIPIEDITVDKVVCWQALIEYLQSTDSDELDDVLVDLTTFSDYMKLIAEKASSELFARAADTAENADAVNKMQKFYFQLTLLLLLDITAAYDFGDEFGRDNLKIALGDILRKTELDEVNVRRIMSIFEQLIPDNESRFKFFIDIINSIAEPSRAGLSDSVRSLVDQYLQKHAENQNLKMKISSLRLKILDLTEEENQMVLRKDYVSAQKAAERLNACREEYEAVLAPILQEQASLSSSGASTVHESMIASRNLSPETVNKCMQICFYLVNSATVQTLSPSLCELHKTFVSRYVTSGVATREWALRVSTSFSMLYDGLSKDTFMLLYQQFFHTSSSRIWQTTIECIFELLDRYGFEQFDVVEKKDESRNKTSRQLYNKMGYMEQEEELDSSTVGTSVDVVRMIYHFLETCEDSEICASIVDGFCRIILRGHYTAQDIVSKLMLKYFNPATESKVQQILGIFFERLIKTKRQEVLQKALLTTLFIILEAPHDSPLNEVRPENVIKFVINSTKPIFCSPGLNPHNMIAMSFLQVILDNLNYKELHKMLSRELLTLEVSEDRVLRKDLVNYVEKILQEPSLDSKVIKNLNSFTQLLEGTYREPLSFSSSRAPPNSASEEAELQTEEALDEERNDKRDSLEESSTPAQERPALNKSILQQTPDTSSDAISPRPLANILMTTEKERRRTSEIVSLRKSLNFAATTSSARVDNAPGSDHIFKVPNVDKIAKPKSTSTKEAKQIVEKVSVSDDSLHGNQMETTKIQQAPVATDALQEDVISGSPNTVYTRFERSRRPLNQVSAKEVHRKLSTPKTAPRTRNVTRNEIINSKIMTRKSLTDAVSGNSKNNDNARSSKRKVDSSNISTRHKTPEGKRKPIDDDKKSSTNRRTKEKSLITSSGNTDTSVRASRSQKSSSSSLSEKETSIHVNETIKQGTSKTTPRPTRATQQADAQGKQPAKEANRKSDTVKTPLLKTACVIISPITPTRWTRNTSNAAEGGRPDRRGSKK